MGRKYYKFLIFVLIAIGLLLVMDYYNFELFHFTIEIFTMFIGVMMFIIAVNSREYSEKALLLPLGVAYLYIGLLDFMHALSFEGMGIIKTSTNISSQYWIAARFMESLGLLVVLFTFMKKIKLKYCYSHVFGLFYVAIVYYLINSERLPAFYIPGVGQTNLKLILATFVIVFLLISIVLTQGIEMKSDNKKLLILILLLKIASEVMFTQYTGLHESFVTIGHILKFVSFAGLYILFISEIVNNPYSKLFSVFQTREEELTILAERDSLTGIYNHSTTFIKIDKMLANIDGDQDIAIILIDIDDFKLVNDTYGHQKGDEVLVEFSQMLLTCDIQGKIVGRYGGDEFVIACPTLTRQNIDERFAIIESRLLKLNKKIGIEFTFSAGVAFYNKGDTTKDLIYKSDIKMYEAKRKGKNCHVIW